MTRLSDRSSVVGRGVSFQKRVSRTAEAEASRLLRFYIERRYSTVGMETQQHSVADRTSTSIPKRILLPHPSNDSILCSLL